MPRQTNCFFFSEAGAPTRQSDGERSGPPLMTQIKNLDDYIS
jgi:hypothetical protein